MNHINQRLLEMKLRLECSGADAGVVSKVWSSIEALDFGGLDTSDLVAYRGCLSRIDLIDWIKMGGSQFDPVVHREVLSMQEATFKLELIRRLDVEDELVDAPIYTQMGGSVVTEQRVKSAFDIAMSMKFGDDWDAQLKNPRGTQSSGTAKIYTDVATVATDAPVFMSSSRQHGRTLVSLKPTEVAKHPSTEVAIEERGTVFVKEVLLHEPLENSIECGIMLKECYEALKVISISMGSTEGHAQESGGKNAGNGNMASGKGQREVFMVGLVEHVRHRQCRCTDGWINVGGDAVNVTKWNSVQSELEAYCTEAGDFTALEGWMADYPNPLESYYSWRFPLKDPRKLAINAMAGVHSSRLTKNGLAPKMINRVVKATYQDANGKNRYSTHNGGIAALDAIRQQQNCERYIQWNVDDQIRKMLGGEKLKSDIRTLKNVDPSLATSRKLDADGNPVLERDANGKLQFVEEISTGFTNAQEFDVSDYYDEIITDEDGNEWTYLELARKMLAKSWITSTKNANREIRKQGERNMGKMYKSKSGKLRTGDKSTTVNGARCAVLTESTLYLDITIGKDRVVPGFENEFANGEFIGELEGNGRRNKIVSAAKLIDVFSALEFDWMTFAAEEIIRGNELKSARADGEDVGHGFAAGSQTLTKDDRERMVKNYMIRLNDLSIESVYMDGDSPWLNIREHCFPEDVTVLCRCINMDELNRLQNARQLVEDCGMDTSDIKQILTAYRKPVLYRKMFFDDSVRQQTWSGLK